MRLVSIQRVTSGTLQDIVNNSEPHYVEIAGASSETKPTTGIAAGSTFLETDTGDLYVFNEAGSAWVKLMTLKE